LNPKLRHLFDLLEADRHQVLEKVDRLSPEQFNKANPGKWSLNQILAHLMTAEEMSLVYMNKKIPGIRETGDTALWEEIKMILLKVSQRLPFRFKAPKAVVERTPTYSDVEQLKSHWEEVRAGLKIFLENFDDDQIRKKIYRHIRAGRLNVQHALIFFHEHYIHHRPQIKRLL
jgi:uncharacterized damage-inducible protein DinB